jgi:hypothetical protein
MEIAAARFQRRAAAKPIGVTQNSGYTEVWSVMMLFESPTLTFLLLFAGICGGGLLLIGIVVPFIAQLFFGFEIYGMIVEAIGEYTGQPRLVQMGCLLLIAVVFSCCCGAVGITAGVVTCFTSTPAALCRLIGR